MKHDNYGLSQESQPERKANKCRDWKYKYVHSRKWHNSIYELDK